MSDSKTTGPMPEPTIESWQMLARAQSKIIERLGNFLDHLPLRASIVCGGERMRNASDAELQAWAWGIEDAQESVRRLIEEWKAKSNAE